jgi:hypothetical protein
MGVKFQCDFFFTLDWPGNRRNLEMPRPLQMDTRQDR